MGSNHLGLQKRTFVGQVRGFSGHSETVTRLRELGFVEGDCIRVAGVVPLGGPILVEVRGAVVALRRQEAQCILV